MIIGIDGNEANVPEKVGVAVYTLELLRYFSNQASKNLQFVVYLRGKPLADLPNESHYFKYKIIRAPRLWRDIVFPFYLYAHPHIDLLFCPAHYSPRFCPVPIVVTVHDVSYAYFKNEFLKEDLHKLTDWTRHAVAHAKKVIAVSHSTRKDILKNYEISASKVTVIHNGFDKSESSYHDKEGTFSIPKSPYILYVGTVQPRKNIQVLLEAYKKLLKAHPHYKLVIVGKMGWLFGDIFEKVLEMGLEDKVIFTGYVSNIQLASLYKKAACFVFPSLYEGFGIPLLEAMSYKCPVIASTAASLPEVGGDACLYFDPHDPNQLAKKIVEIIESDDLRKTWVKKGLERVKQFSWEKSARETLKTLVQACHSIEKIV